jgi:WXG100 family type VII secretion target
MPSIKIQIQYDELDGMSGEFSQMSGEVEQMISKVKSCFEVLQGGGWIGRGAEAFFAEMNDMVFPALERLKNVLEESGRQTKTVIVKFREAETQASSRFRS